MTPKSPKPKSKPKPKAAPADGKRPSKRNPDATRFRILQAAIREFSSEGYGGARIDAICKRARANPRMIYHYFGDKDGLYVSVLEHVLGELRAEEFKLEVDHVPPLEGMLQLFRFIHDHFGSHPELIALLSGENLLKARFLKRSVKTPIVASPLTELIAKLLARGVKENAFRAGISPLHLYVTLVALSYFHRSNAYTLSVIFRTDLLDTTWQEEHRREAEQLLVRYLAKPAGARRGDG